MSNKSFSGKCTACQSKITVVYAPTVEVIAGWGTEMVPRDHRTFVCAACGKPLLAQALEVQPGNAPTKTEPDVPVPAPQATGTGWGSSRSSKPKGVGWG